MRVRDLLVRLLQGYLALPGDLFFVMARVRPELKKNIIAVLFISE